MPKRTRDPILLIPHHSRKSGLFLAGDQYVADIKPNDGKRTIRKLRSTRDAALLRFDALLLELGQHENPLLSAYLLQTFLPSQRSLKAYDYAERCVGLVAAWADAEAPSLRVSGVNRSHVEQLRAHYERFAPRTLNMVTQKLKQALNYAVDIGILDANPIVRVKQLSVDNRRVKCISLDDFCRILHEARNTHAHDMFIAIGLTGLRPSNVRLLTADEVDADIVCIPPQKMKNGRWGIIPISSAVQSLLETREASPYFFPARGTSGSPKSLENLSRSYRTIARRVEGVEWSTLYDLRHFFASQLARHGATEQQIGRLLCHVGQSVTSRYVHHDIEDLRPFVEQLSESACSALRSA
ncbi:MAG: tyrosine-type recombinase/integrase [Candidatus Poribacteria bacterium]